MNHGKALLSLIIQFIEYILYLRAKVANVVAAYAIAEAIDKQSQQTNGQYITDKPTQVVSKDTEYDFDGLMNEFQDLVGQLMSSNQTNAVKITAITDKYLGKGKKVGECTPDQSEQLDLIVHDLKDLMN